MLFRKTEKPTLSERLSQSISRAFHSAQDSEARIPEILSTICCNTKAVSAGLYQATESHFDLIQQHIEEQHGQSPPAQLHRKPRPGANDGPVLERRGSLTLLSWDTGAVALIDCNHDEDLQLAQGVATALLKSALEVEALKTELGEVKEQAAATSSIVASNLDSRVLLEALLEQAARSSDHQGAFIATFDDDIWHLRASFGVSDRFEQQTQLQGISVLFETIELEEVTLVQPSSAAKSAQFGISTILLVPIGADTEVIGVFGLINRCSNIDKSTNHEAMTGFAEQIARVVARDRELRQFSRAYEETLRTLANGVDLARGCPHHHERVANLAIAIGEEAGIANGELDILRRAAKIHDVGLVSGAQTPEGILSEFQHPTLGAALVQPLPDGERIATIIAQHHETYDGFGFPDGLKGSALDSLGQVLACSEWAVERQTGNALTPGNSFSQLAKQLHEEADQARFSPEVSRAAIVVLSKVVALAAKQYDDD